MRGAGRGGLGPWVLCYLVAWSCAQWAQGKESGGQLCEGLNSCESVSLDVYRGGTQSLNLSINEDWQKLVTKCDPETKTWKEVILSALGKANTLMDKTTSISLVNRNFTVQNAEKTEEGLYKIERYLDNSCLAVINVTVLDLPLPVAVVSSFDVSSTVTSKVNETSETSPPGRGTSYIAIALYIALPIFLIAIIAAVVCWVRGLHRSQRRPNEATAEVDPEQLMNGSLSHQQEESTPV